MTKFALLAASVVTLSGAGLLLPTLIDTTPTAHAAVQTPPPPRPGDRAPPPGGPMDGGPRGQRGEPGLHGPARMMGQPVVVEGPMLDGSKMQEKGKLMDLGPDWVVIDSPDKGMMALNARFIYAVRMDPSAPKPMGGPKEMEEDMPQGQ